MEVRTGAQGKSRKARTDAETMEKHCFLALLSLISYKPLDHLPRDGTAYSVPGPPIEIINQERPCISAYQGIFSIKMPSSWMTREQLSWLVF